MNRQKVTLAPITSSTTGRTSARVANNKTSTQGGTSMAELKGLGIKTQPPLAPFPPSNINHILNATVVESSTASSTTDSLDASLKKVIPGFVSKLYRMVDESTSNLIKWGTDGTTFIVTNTEDFARHVLPLFFKHNNFSSFVRQLNMYGFHKIPHIQQGSIAAASGLNNDSTTWEFSHSSFKRGRPDLLLAVKRKLGKDEEGSGSASSANSGNTGQIGINGGNLLDTVNALRTELLMLRQQQVALRGDLQSIQQDNQLLWSEHLASRERHSQQQQVIDRILRFLASVFTSTDPKLAGGNAFSSISGGNNANATGSTNRKRPLMIGDVGDFDGGDLKRQVLELIGNTGDNVKGRSQVINEVEVDDSVTETPSTSTIMSNNRNRLNDLNLLTEGLQNDISLLDNHLDTLETGLVEDNEEDPLALDFDLSNYLNVNAMDGDMFGTTAAEAAGPDEDGKDLQ